MQNHRLATMLQGCMHYKWPLLPFPVLLNTQRPAVLKWPLANPMDWAGRLWGQLLIKGLEGLMGLSPKYSC